MLNTAAAALILISSAAIAQNQPAPPAPQQERPTPEQIFAFLDGDKDGFISREEARGPLADFFDNVDSDQDGKISPAELKTVMDAMQGR